MTDETSMPLEGVVVLDLSRALAGPHAAMMLADMGARVIKVEMPGRGDDTRSWGPPFVGPNQDISTYYLSCNRNKESLELDLGNAEDKQLLLRLVRHADVLIENFRPGWLDGAGLSTDTLHEANPRLVVLSLTGFGHDGPEGLRRGYDQIGQGEAGIMSITGPDADAPTKVGTPIGDLSAGMYGAFGAVTALYERERTGRGRVVRASLLSALVGIHAFQGADWLVGGVVRRGAGNHHPSIAPYGLFQAADGPVQIACGSQDQWRRLCGLLGIDPAADGMATNLERVQNRDLVIDTVNAACSRIPALDLLVQLEDAGIAAGKVRTIDEVYSWEQTRSQGLVIEVAHPELGAIELAGPPVRFDNNAHAGGRMTHTAPPALGQHNDTVRAWLDEMEGQ
ncbi:CoA transferase [Luteococcus peritonei]|uniref:CaiB/BaiF CoA transferase family protein n=1 Tax=Luteococcus peritonei TaxID=88874 RepID=A0ABW4RXC2_9ACTN